MGVAITVIVGFGAALLGAIAGFLGALHIDTRRTRRTRTGVVRALIGELRRNGTAVVQVLYSGRAATEYSSDTWQAANFELAQFLSEPLYQDILVLYITLPTIKRFSNVSPSAKEQRKLLEGWLERAKKAINDLQQLPEAAGFRSEPPESLALLEEAGKTAERE
jgi:hypothetical protein